MSEEGNFNPINSDSTDSSIAAHIDSLVSELLKRQEAGESIDIHEIASQYPAAWAQVIHDLWGVRQFIDRDKPTSLKREPPNVNIPDYEIVRELGRGGMGIVYEAIQTRLNRRVALKVLPHEPLDSSAAVARFQIEANAAASLHHTNIVPVFEAGEINGTAFYAMQLIEGWGLDRIRDAIRDSRSDRRSKSETEKRETTVSTAAWLNAPLSQAHEEPKFEVRLHDRVDFNRLENRSLADDPTADDPQNSDQAIAQLHRPAAAIQVPEKGLPHWQFVSKIGIQVASALHHAHQRGIIHRDVKPANIILDREGIAWLTDFGLAKRGESDLTRTTEAPGTLRYMAPERFQGECSPASDLYALGISLYELLLCQSPFSATDRLAVMEQIRQGRILSIRQIEPSIPLDLETIIKKTIAHLPTDRYSTAEDLAEDLRRFLDGRPILSRPISSIERLYRWSRRNPSLATSLATLLFTLIAVSLGASWAAVSFNNLAKREIESREQAETARDQANELATLEQAARQEENRQRKYAESITEFVTEDILALTSVEGQMRFLPDNWDSLGKDASVSALMARAASKLPDRHDLEPRAQAEIAWMIGVSLRAVGKHELAIEMLQRSFELNCGLTGEESDGALRAESSLAVAYRAASQYARAVERFQSVFDKTTRVYGDSDPRTLQARQQLEIARLDGQRQPGSVATFQVLSDQFHDKFGETDWATLQTQSFLIETLFDDGEFAKALELNSKLLQTAQQHVGPNDRLTMNILIRQSKLLQQVGRFREAVEAAEQAYRAAVATMGSDDPYAIGYLSEYSDALRHIGDLTQATELGEQAYQLAQQHWGADHIGTIRAGSGLAACYRDQGRFAEALAITLPSSERLHEVLGDRHPSTLRVDVLLAQLLNSMGEYQKSLTICQQTHAAMSDVFGTQHPETTTCLLHMGSAWESLGDIAQAIRAYEQANEQGSANSPSGRAVTLINLAGAYLNVNRVEEASKHYSTAIDLLSQSYGADHRLTLIARCGYAASRDRLGHSEFAVEQWTEVLAKQSELFGASHSDTLTTANNLGFGYMKVARFNEAIETFEAVMEPSRQHWGESHPSFLRLLGNLAAAYDNVGQVEKAEAIWRETCQILRDTLGAVHPNTQNMLRNLGVSLYRRQQYAAAVEVFAEATNACREGLGDSHPQTLRMAGNLGINLLKNDQPQQAFETLVPVARAGRTNPNMRFVLWSFMEAAVQMRETSHVLETAEQLESHCRDEYRNDPAGLAKCWVDLAEALLTSDAVETAERYVTEYFTWRATEQPIEAVEDWRYFAALSLQARVVASRQQWEMANDLFQKAREGLANALPQAQTPQQRRLMQKCLETGADVLDRLDRTDEAKRWREQSETFDQ